MLHHAPGCLIDGILTGCVLCSFAKTLPQLKRARMGSYSWGLINGRSQAQFEWGSKPGTPEPKIWFTDIFRDIQGTPFDPKEIEAIKAVAHTMTEKS